ncbi:Collagen alpha-2(IV) chain, partial [Temnothorax longispinosus]
GTPGIPGIPGKPGKPGTPSYPGHPGTPGIPGTPGTPGFPGTPSYPGHAGTPGIPGIPGKPGKPGTPSYPGHPGTPGIPGTPGTPGFPGTPSYPGHPGTHEIPGTPGIVELPLYPTYPVTPGTSFSFDTSGILEKPGKLLYRSGTYRNNTWSIISLSGTFGTSEMFNIPGKPGRPSYPGYPIYPVTSETPDAPSHSETPGHPGYPAYPESTEDSKSPEGPIGGVGGIGDIGGVGDIGPDGPDGPWPTGSPGPDGPWPGDPDYIPGIKPTRRPSYKEPIRNYHPATYSFDTDKYNSISQYNFNNKTDSSYTGYTLKDIELSKLSRPTDVDTSLYLHQKPQYEIQSPIYGKKETIYNANKINSLLQTSSTPSSLKYEIEDHQYINAFKLNPQLYDHLIHTEPQQIKKPLKNDFNQFSVHDQDQYQKTIFYPSYNSQRQSKVLNEFKKLEQEEDAFNVDGQYNNSANVDSKAISNVSFQSDGPSSAPERQVNARLEQTFRTNFAVDAIGVQPPSSINVKPFSLPIGPNPQSCPCYLVEPNNNTNVETSSTLTSVIGQFGFIPVIFVPYCPGNEMDSDKMKIMFPSATPVPYACDTCDTQDSKIIVKPLDINQLGNIDYLKEALNQTNLGFLNVPVKTVERRRSKSRKAK